MNDMMRMCVQTPRGERRRGVGVVASMLAAVLGSGAASAQLDLPENLRGGPLATPLPPIIIPAENPITEEKRVLGKILFWDAQLSSDNTMSCGSCHFPANGGTDPRRFPNPGRDNAYGTEDDKFTSRGIIRALKNGEYDPSPAFGLDPQATDRTAPSTLMPAHFGDLFWDGRATGEFRDPETGETVIPFNGSMESQAVEPILSSVEMAHDDRDWDEVTGKLERSVPLALAREIPADMRTAVASSAGYPELFERAFGDADITASRIGMAIATYERTLVPDQTPWDLYAAGDTEAMTPEQRQGWLNFSGNLCVACHTPPTFTDLNFHSVGVRPDSDDPGRAGFTGFKPDAGSFKTPSLRNIGLKSSFMHTGSVATIADVFDVYASETDFQANPNRSLFLPIVLSPFEEESITHFLTTALTDPRAAAEEFPFDRPRLYSEWATGEWSGGNPASLAGGVAGSGGVFPRMIAAIPPNLGNQEFRIGLDDALGGATAFVAISDLPPEDGVVRADTLEGPYTVSGDGPGAGYATHLMPLPADSARAGDVLYLQWRIEDPAAPGGVALTRPVRIELFCNGRCPDGGTDVCDADIAEPTGVLDLADLQAFVGAFMAGDETADLAAPFGVLDLGDVQAFVTAFLAGCP
jgi:cytochrome c peroxidase